MNIIGKSECTASQMAQYLISKNPNAKPWALEYAKLYLEEGEAEGVRGDGAWYQSCKETGNFKFDSGTAVTFDQNNFCGLGVTRKGLKGHSFETPRLGIRAQIQHLKGYATTAPLKNPCIDPRYKYITKGCAPRFEDLAGKWAVPGYNTNLASSLEDAMAKGIGYGFDIIAGINKMKSLTVTDEAAKDSSSPSTTPSGNSNSSLVSYTKISPNKTSPRTHKIDTITIHCIVGQWTAKQGCDYFAKSTAQASANYVVGKDGSIGLCVEEKDRSWCSSNAANDHRAVTIEVASDTTHPYAVTDKALAALIKLCADICKRNGIKKLLWKGDKSLIGQIDKQNMTVHRWFKNKACPGDFLYERHGYIADEVNKLLGTSFSSNTTSNLYRVRKSWADSASQKGAYASLDNAKKNCPSGYSVFDKDGKCVYSNVPAADNKKYYRVQTGSYAIGKNAIALQERLKKDGFNSIIKKEGLLHKVQVGAYSQKSNAEAMLKNLKAKGYSAFIVYA